MTTDVLNNPRITVRPSRTSETGGTEYLIDGAPPTAVSPQHKGYMVIKVGEGWSGSETRTGWVVFNGFCVWIGSDNVPADRENEIEAKDVYPSAEAAVEAVLTALDNG
jgi:hypothetical protein